MDKIIARIDQIQQTQKQKAAFFAALSLAQGLGSLKTLGSFGKQAYKANYMSGHKQDWYKKHQVGTKLVSFNKEVTSVYDPTPEQKTKAKEYSEGKWENKVKSIKDWKTKYETKHPKATNILRKTWRFGSGAMSTISFGASMVALYLSISQLINEKSAKEEWEGLMKNHTEGITKVKEVLTSINLQSYKMSKIEMSTESKQFLVKRLNILIEVKMSSERLQTRVVNVVNNLEVNIRLDKQTSVKDMGSGKV